MSEEIFPWQEEVDRAKRIKQYLKNPDELLKLDSYEAGIITTKLDLFYRKYLSDARKDGLVLGLSSGIDSTAAGFTAVHALGQSKVFGFLIPSKYTPQEDIDDAIMVAEKLGIHYAIADKELFDREIETDNAIDQNLESQLGAVLDIKGDTKIMIGNDHARTRMKILRRAAQKYNCLVLGTTNLSETLLGYATIAGDGYKGVDIEPLQRLFKTTLWDYSRRIGVPKKIIQKTPSAGLWKGQTDETEIGMSYFDLDRILLGRELRLSPEDIVQANKNPKITLESVQRISDWVKGNKFKGKPEPFAELSGGIRYE